MKPEDANIQIRAGFIKDIHDVWHSIDNVKEFFVDQYGAAFYVCIHVCKKSGDPKKLSLELRPISKKFKHESEAVATLNAFMDVLDYEDSE